MCCRCREAVSRHAGTAIVPFFETSGDIAHKTYKKLNTMKTILLESKKNVAVVECPHCGTIYSFPQEDAFGWIVTNAEDPDVTKQYVSCPHCHNYNDYSKAVWYESSEVDAAVNSKQYYINRLRGDKNNE